MHVIKMKKGVDLPISGAVATGGAGNTGIRDVDASSYALLANDYPCLKPSVLVKNGDEITAGTPLVKDKNSGVEFICPVSGVVREVIRGDRRAFIGISVDVKDSKPWKLFDNNYDPDGISKQEIQEYLFKSGLWTSIKARPFGMVADPEFAPSALFITAMDTRPLGCNVDVALTGRHEHYTAGVTVLSKLCSGKTYVCVSPASGLPVVEGENIETVGFDGPHPAGLAGTHIHFLHPVDRKRHVWVVDYQDVASIGELFLTGVVNNKKVIALAGEGFKKPEYIRTFHGADLAGICGSLLNDDCRLISGSVLYGCTITETYRWLGRFDNQVSAIPHGKPTGFMSWLFPFSKYYSVKNIFFNKPRKYIFDTSMHGSLKAMVPVGSYEKIMPMDIIMTPFLRYLVVNDYEMAEKLGALELLEEDLSLATFVSPEKTDFAPLLRESLESIRKEM